MSDGAVMIWGMTTHTLSHSGRTDFQMCQRMFYLGRVKGMRRVLDPAGRRMGKWFAHVLEHGLGTHEAMVAEALSHANTDDDARRIQIDGAVVAVISEAYCRWYGDLPASVKVTREFEFRDPIVGHGFIDELQERTLDLARGPYQHRKGVEDKFLTSHFWRNSDADALDIDPQLTAYFYAMRAAGTPLDEYEFRATMKPGLHVKVGDTAETYAERVAADVAKRPEFYFRSYLQTRTDAQLDEFESEAKDINRQYKQAVRSNSWPKAPKSICSLFGGCHFLPICRNTFTPGDYTIKPMWPKGTNDRQKLAVRVVNDAFPPAVPTADVAKQMGVDARGAAATLRACETRGLVAVVERDDRGTVYWDLTPLARRLASDGR